MQFHLNGFLSRDPEFTPEADTSPRWGEQADVVDVLIVGAGPAGSILATQLAAFPGISTRLIDRRESAMVMGNADGVACRSVEMFNAFGVAERLLRESYWVNETVFWGPGEADPSCIERKGRVDHITEGFSEFPHVIVNQARIQEYLVDRMRKSPRRIEPEFGLQVTAVEASDDPEEPVTVRLRRTSSHSRGEEVTIRARYVVGCDGARSMVRQSIGRTPKGDPQNQAWGVIDILGNTDYPDVRTKSIISSKEHGNTVIIPREGGYMFRLYVDLGKVDDLERGVLNYGVTSDQVIEAAQKIFAPYTIDVKDVVWWSVYEVGQRVTDKFDNSDDENVPPRVFIAGDACHTHSAKGGQGMNVSMQDAFNLGWKLAAVLEGRSPASILHSYSFERQPVAEELIDFDRRLAPLMAGKQNKVSHEEIKAQFEQQSRYHAGVATHYPESLLVGSSAHQHLAQGCTVGMRFHSAPVVRVADGRQMHLGHVHEADGRWRVYVFADAAKATEPHSPFNEFVEFLANSEDSPVRQFTPAGTDIDSVFDVRAVLQDQKNSVDVEQVHPFLLPRKGKFGLKDLEKVFVRDTAEDIFALRDIDVERGAVVVVRPDQYVAHVLPLEAREELTEFFGRFMNRVS